MLVQRDYNGKITLVVMQGEEFTDAFSEMMRKLNFVKELLTEDEFSYPEKRIKKADMAEAYHRQCLLLAERIEEARKDIRSVMKVLPTEEWERSYNVLTGEYGDYHNRTELMKSIKLTDSPNKEGS